jgi:hypothetical protein
MKRRSLVLAFATLPISTALRANSPPAAIVVIYKDASCVCCGKWAEHLEAAGFTVDVREVRSTSVMRRQLGMPQEFGACHTAKVGDYVIEGHVPADEVRRLLAVRPTAIGLSVPRMPVGSPGMEFGNRVDAYEVLLVDRERQATVFARYPKPNR